VWARALLASAADLQCHSADAAPVTRCERMQAEVVWFATTPVASSWRILLASLTLACGGARQSRWAPPEAAARIYQEAAVDQPPTPIRFPTPRYPADLRQREVPGRVELEYVIDPDGRVEPGSIRVVTATHGAFARSAIEAVKEALYEPGIRAGVRVRVQLKHVLYFRVRPH
jgi:TonB family protein